MSFKNLPSVAFTDTDAANIEASVISVYEGLAETTLYPGDPVRLFLLSLAAIITQQRQVIDYTGRQNMLAYASGAALDHLGAFADTDRLQATAAQDTCRFSLDAILGYAVAIPKGTRISPDGKLWFQTTSYTEISSGSLYADVMISCEQTGSIGNGFVAGQINKLAVPIPDVGSAANTGTSSGGSDIENDEAYRQRIQMAPEHFSVAGPTLAYDFWARAAHQDIADVAVYRSEPLAALSESQLEQILDILGVDYTDMDQAAKQIAVASWLSSATVNITPLLTSGQIPDQTMLDLIAEAVDDRNRRPLTDKVEVAAPTEVSYAITLQYFIATESVSIVAEIKAAVEQAVSDFATWQKSKLGRNINDSKLNQMIMEAGASRVIITSPPYTEVAVNAVAVASDVSVTYGGIDE